MSDATGAPDLLFVYGTLMRDYGGEWSARLADMGERLGRGTVPGRLYMVSWYPGLTEPDADGQRVSGEVWRLSDPETAWPDLDEYEGLIPGAPDVSRYRRQAVEVTMDDGAALTSQAYYLNYPVDDLERIESGDFRDVPRLGRG